MGVLVPNYLEENIVKLGDQETGTSNVFQILQDLRIKQYQGKSESKTHRPSTTFTTSTKRQPKVSKTHKTASQKAGTVNMSQIPTPCRTMPPPKPEPKPIPHTVLDNQPLEHIKFTHTMDLQLAACMYTNSRVRPVGWENRQP